MRNLGYLDVSTKTVDACLHSFSFLALYCSTLNKNLLVVYTAESGKSFQISKQGKTICLIFLLFLLLDMEALAR